MASYTLADDPETAARYHSAMTFEGRVVEKHGAHTSPKNALGFRLKWNPIIVEVTQVYSGSLAVGQRLAIRDLTPSLESAEHEGWNPRTFKKGNRLMIFSQEIVDIKDEGSPAATPNYLYILADGRAQSGRMGHEDKVEDEARFRERVESNRN